MRDRSRETPVPAYLLAFVLMGIAVSLSGPALSHLRDRMHTNDGGIAWVFVGQSIGYIGGSALAGRGLDRGRGHAWWAVAIAVTTVSVVLVAAAPNLVWLVLAFVVLGAAAGLSDASGNTLVMWSRPNGAGSLLNALHLCFAIGALCSPVLVNRSLHYTDSVWGVAVPIAVIGGACTVMMLRHPPPVRTRMETVERSRAGGARGLHVALVCLFFFSYVALEAGFAGWIHSYVEQIGYGGSGTATGMITTFWVGFMLGRMAAIWLARIFSPGRMVAAAMNVSVLASILFAVFQDAGPMLWVVTFLFAVSVAPQYASMMAFAESHLALSGRNTAAIIAASGLGGLFMPWLLGQLFDNVGPRALPPTIIVGTIAAALIALLVGRALLSVDDVSQRPPATSMNEPVT